MKTFNRALKLLAILAYALVLGMVLVHQATASAKFTKETGKKCLDCHRKIPKKGETNLYLTELGEKFKANGNKMPSESSADKK